MKHTTAARAGYVSCTTCGLLMRQPRTAGVWRCARCHAVLEPRITDSVRRTWSLLIAAAVLYIPANLLPVLRTSSLFGTEDNTIMSGVAYFWSSGSWGLAIIVFVASIMVPMLKLGVLTLLLITTQRRSRWRLQQRATLYRVVERIGRWSMLDVFVIAMTVALVRFNTLAVITPGPGAVAFGCVVVLTMLATMQFDPRLIWDPCEPEGIEADEQSRPEPAEPA